MVVLGKLLLLLLVFTDIPATLSIDLTRNLSSYFRRNMLPLTSSLPRPPRLVWCFSKVGLTSTAFIPTAIVLWHSAVLFRSF